MLSHEENRRLTQVGPGTPMGEMLRRYWQPVGCSELVTRKPQRTMVMGEELLLYRGDSGQPVLMQLRCAHRSLALDYGRVEGDCIRCPYHGWLYDSTGQCLEQPAEPDGSRFAEKIKIKSYPTQEAGGFVFAYMGAAPAPVLPLYDLLRAEEGVKVVLQQNINANWLNHVENTMDMAHLRCLHGYTVPSDQWQDVTYSWEPTEYGIDNWAYFDGVPSFHSSRYVFPNVNRFCGPIEKEGHRVSAMIYRVPIDDENTYLYMTRFYRSDKPSFRSGRRVNKLGVYAPLEEDWWGIQFVDQDRMAAEQQGRIPDRTQERLAVTDKGIIMMRQMMRDSLKLIAEGKDPLCLVREPAKQNIELGDSPALNAGRPDNPKAIFDPLATQAAE
jgi:5,5'-dehydrodivanillate O-demethylase